MKNDNYGVLSVTRSSRVGKKIDSLEISICQNVTVLLLFERELYFFEIVFLI